MSEFRNISSDDLEARKDASLEKYFEKQQYLQTLIETGELGNLPDGGGSLISEVLKLAEACELDQRAVISREIIKQDRLMSEIEATKTAKKELEEDGNALVVKSLTRITVFGSLFVLSAIFTSSTKLPSIMSENQTENIGILEAKHHTARKIVGTSLCTVFGLLALYSVRRASIEEHILNNSLEDRINKALEDQVPRDEQGEVVWQPPSKDDDNFTPS